MAQEISILNHERQELQRKLAGLTAREEELRGKADEAISLTQEVQALEDLLEEAASDIETKDNEITGLEKNLKSAARATSSSGKSKASESLARRLRTLYKDLEVDDHALETMVALRDETMKLKAEEALKRLGDEADNVTVRRKVGGLPNHLKRLRDGFRGQRADLLCPGQAEAVPDSRHWSQELPGLGYGVSQKAQPRRHELALTPKCSLQSAQNPGFIIHPQKTRLLPGDRCHL